jgi:hypothetical protein
MPVRRTLTTGLLALSTFVACAASVKPDTTHIPEIQGTTFAGTEVELPQALAGKVGVLVIGFTRGSQDNARSWGELLARRYPQDSKVAYYELPVLAAVPTLLRGWVVGRIRQSVAEPFRAHFLPVLDHAAQWKQIACGPVTDSACVLVVDDSGNVRWRYQGAADGSAFAELQRQVDLVRPS